MMKNITTMFFFLLLAGCNLHYPWQAEHTPYDLPGSRIKPLTRYIALSRRPAPLISAETKRGQALQPSASVSSLSAVSSNRLNLTVRPDDINPQPIGKVGEPPPLSRDKRSQIITGAGNNPSASVEKTSDGSNPVSRWRAEQGATLKDTLYQWAAAEACANSLKGNWNVIWLTEVNYRIDAPLFFSGSFREALTALFRLYSAAKVPLYAGISRSQCLLKVDTKGRE